MLTANNLRDYIMSGLTCDHVEVQGDGIKVYSNWPTIPQLYIKGEFVGGADIVREMYEQGELQKLLQSALA